MCGEARVQRGLQDTMINQYIMTGCDKNTEWQLPWFVENFNRHCESDLVIVDFGMTVKMREYADKKADHVFSVERKGWFSKIEAMHLMKAKFSGSFCWLDTDCQVLGDIGNIFRYVENNKLTMVVDHPWTTHGSPWTPQSDVGPWYNTGVIAFEGRPAILDRWLKEVKDAGKHRGDQEAMYSILNESHMNRPMHIVEAPHKFNVLRIDVSQERVPSNPIVMHWTGQKGNEEIRRQMQ